MPIVRVTLAAGRSVQQKQAAAKAVTAAIVEHCGAHAEHVYVLFEDVPAEEWTVGGETVAERMRRRGES